jgi:hypothetical protein
LQLLELACIHFPGHNRQRIGPGTSLEMTIQLRVDGGTVFLADASNRTVREPFPAGEAIKATDVIQALIE